MKPEKRKAHKPKGDLVNKPISEFVKLDNDDWLGPYTFGGIQHLPNGPCPILIDDEGNRVGLPGHSNLVTILSGIPEGERVEIHRLLEDGQSQKSGRSYARYEVFRS